MTEVCLDYDQKLRELVSKWEDKLDANHDDYICVDGEEGDFGIVRYFGTDLNGVENVHLMTKYVHGGDAEESFYTPAGTDVVQKIMRDNFETFLHRSLEESLDPGSQNGMYHGFVADTKKAGEIADREGRAYEKQLHTRYAELFPTEIKDGAIYRFGFKYYVAVVSPPKFDDQKPKIHFYNIINPLERLAIKIGDHDHLLNLHQFHADHDTWRDGFVDCKIKSVSLDGVVDDKEAYSQPNHTPTLLPI